MMGDILGPSGYAAIDGSDRVPPRKQEITEMRADKARPARDQDPHNSQYLVDIQEHARSLYHAS